VNDTDRGPKPRSQEPLETRAEFPYHWDADEFTTRRDLLRMAVLTSGAIFAATVAIAVRSAFASKTRGSRKVIVRADEVPPGEAHYFNYPGDGEQAVLINLPNRGFVAYSQRCTHLACAVRYEADRNRLHCPCHEGVFSVETGDPTAGPPQRRLPVIVLEEQDGMIYAVEERL
jgi:Rieske Fe-S protein